MLTSKLQEEVENHEYVKWSNALAPIRMAINNRFEVAPMFRKIRVRLEKSQNIRIQVDFPYVSVTQIFDLEIRNTRSPPSSTQGWAPTRFPWAGSGRFKDHKFSVLSSVLIKSCDYK